MDQAAVEFFEFLMNHSGFDRTSTESGYLYRSKSITVQTSYNERDGFGTDLFFPGKGTERVSVGTILGALDFPKPHEAKAHAMFIESNLSKLTSLSLDVYTDLAELRFWHTTTWRSHWGKSISLDSATIENEKARLLRLKEFFSRNDA